MKLTTTAPTLTHAQDPHVSLRRQIQNFSMTMIATTGQNVMGKLEFIVPKPSHNPRKQLRNSIHIITIHYEKDKT